MQSGPVPLDDSSTPKIVKQRLWVSGLLICLNVLGYLLSLYYQGLIGGPKGLFQSLTLNSLFALGANCPAAVAAGDGWRLITSTYLHTSRVHLFLNMIALWALGRYLEPALGVFRFLALYSLSGLGGSLATALFSNTVLSVGASGAIFGLFGTFLVLAANDDKRAISLVIAINLAYGLASPHVDNFAHAGGLASGFLVTRLSRGRSRAWTIVPLVVVAGMLIWGLFRIFQPVDWGGYPQRAFTFGEGRLQLSLPSLFRQSKTFLLSPFGACSVEIRDIHDDFLDTLTDSRQDITRIFRAQKLEGLDSFRTSLGMWILWESPRAQVQKSATTVASLFCGLHGIQITLSNNETMVQRRQLLGRILHSVRLQRELADAPLALTAIRNKDFASLVTLAGKNATDYPRDWSWLYLRGIALEGVGRLEEAASAFQASADQLKGKAAMMPLQHLLLCQSRLENWPKVLECADKILVFAPNAPQVLNERAYALLHMGRPAEALTSTRQAQGASEATGAGAGLK